MFFYGLRKPVFCSPDDGFLQLRLGVVDHMLQDPPQRNGNCEEHKHTGDEPGFAVSPDLHRQGNRTSSGSGCMDQMWIKQADAGV